MRACALQELVAALDSQLSPESTLREETTAVISMDDICPLLDATPPLDHAAAITEAAAWLAGREPGEQASRVAALPLTSAPG